MESDIHESIEEAKFLSNYPGSQKSLQAKNVFFYRDGHNQRGFVKIAVHPSRYRSLDALLNELTQKMPDMSYGVRSIFTPKGHNRLKSLEELNNDGNYVCSQSPNKAKGVDLSKTSKAPVTWNIKKPMSQFRFNTAPLGTGENDLRIKKFEKRERGQIRAPASVPESESENYLSNEMSPRKKRAFLPGLKRNENKKILVRKNGSPDYQHVVFLNRRMVKSFEHFIDELCGMFLMPVHRLYTVDGKPVESLSAIFNGPDVFVAAGFEKFRPMAAWAMSDSIDTDYRMNNGTTKPKVKKNAISRGVWRIKVQTLDTEPESGTTANVFITIYGKFRCTAQLPLNLPVNVSDAPLFQPGQIDEFEVTTGNIGSITKIRLHHDNSGSSPEWMLGTVQLENRDTDETLVFSFNRWLSRTKDNYETCRELPAINEGGFVLPMMKYRVVVYTGDCWNAGTDGKIFICLYGEYGDSGARQLLQPLFYSAKLFQKSSCDTFEIEAVNLGRLKRLIIGHNAIGPGYGWFLDKVIVQMMPTTSDSKVPKMEVVFPCNMWLDQGEDDGKTTRELKPQDDFRHTQMEKEMWDYEKWKFQSKNHIVMYSPTTLKCVQFNANGSVDAAGEEKSPNCIMEVISGDTKEICAFKSIAYKGRIITMQGSEVTGGNGKGVAGIDSEFKIRVQPDRTVVFETVRHINHHIMVNPHNFGLVESRGPVTLPGKGFFIYCKGVFRDEAIVCFCTSLIQTLAVTHDNQLTATGKRNRTAYFVVHKVVEEQKMYMFESVVFPNQFLRIKSGRCDCRGAGDQDCLFKVEKYRDKGFVTLQSIESRGLYIGMNQDGSCKPSVDTGEKNVRLFPEIIKPGHQAQKTQREAPVLDQIEQSINPSYPSQTQRSDNFSDNVMNIAQLSNDAEEKEYYTEGDWKVFVKSNQNAERCEVTMYVYGDEGCSGPVFLGKSGDKNALFQSGNVDEFKINIPIIGSLFKIRIETKPTEIGVTPFWILKEVIMENIVTEDRYLFPFNNKSFGRGYDDNELSRESALVTSEEGLPLVRYKVWLCTGSELDADCGAPVSVTIFGEYGDTGDREFYTPFLDVQPSFRRGMTDEMVIESVYLGEISECRITVHTTVPGTGWFCHNVVVEDPLTLTQVIFSADRWFDSAKDDGQTSRILKPDGFKPAAVDDVSNEEDPTEIHRQAKELIDVITEQAAIHVEQYHEMQIKQIQNGHYMGHS